MHHFLCLALLCSAHFLSAQHHEPLVAGGVSNSLGQNRLTFTNAFTAIHNQGALPFVTTQQIGAFARRSFAVEGVDDVTISAVLPFQNSGIGIAANHFGYSAYSEQQIRLGYGRLLARHFGLGIGFTALRTQMAEYGTAMAVAIEMGLYYRMTDKFTLAAHTFNPSSSSLSPNLPTIPAVIGIGFSYHSTDLVSFYGEVVKSKYQPLQLKGGIAYNLHERIQLRAGTLTQPVQFTFGIGYTIAPLTVDVAYAYHPVLGSTPMISMQFSRIPVKHNP